MLACRLPLHGRWAFHTMPQNPGTTKWNHLAGEMSCVGAMVGKIDGAMSTNTDKLRHYLVVVFEELVQVS